MLSYLTMTLNFTSDTNGSLSSQVEIEEWGRIWALVLPDAALYLFVMFGSRISAEETNASDNATKLRTRAV